MLTIIVRALRGLRRVAFVYWGKDAITGFEISSRSDLIELAHRTRGRGELDGAAGADPSSSDRALHSVMNLKRSEECFEADVDRPSKLTKYEGHARIDVG